MENAEKKRALPNWAGSLLIWCLPTLALLFLTRSVFGIVVSGFTAITYCLIIVIGLLISLLIYTILAYRAGKAKAWLITVIVALLLLLGFFSLFFPVATHRSAKRDAKAKFETGLSSAYLYPELVPLEIGSPEAAEYHLYHTVALIFESDSYVLLCRYGEAEYEAEKAALESRYEFRTTPLDAEKAIGRKAEKQLEPHAVIGNDSFRFIKPDDADDTEYFTRCLMVVTNDEKREIGYILYYDIDLDVAEDLVEFINDNCGWSVIR